MGNHLQKCRVMVFVFVADAISAIRFAYITCELRPYAHRNLKALLKRFFLTGSCRGLIFESISVSEAGYGSCGPIFKLDSYRTCPFLVVTLNRILRSCPLLPAFPFGVVRMLQHKPYTLIVIPTHAQGFPNFGDVQASH